MGGVFWGALIFFGPAGKLAFGVGGVVGVGEFLEEVADDLPAVEVLVFEDGGGVGVTEGGEFGGNAFGWDDARGVKGEEERLPELRAGGVGHSIEAIQGDVARGPSAVQANAECALSEAFFRPARGALRKPAVFEEGGAVLDEVEEFVGGSQVLCGINAGGDGEADAEGVWWIAGFAKALEFVVGDAVGF